ncbi:MAG: cell wall hydrolase [Limnochordia bacterium]
MDAVAEIFGTITFENSRYTLREVDLQIGSQRVKVFDGRFRAQVQPGRSTILASARHYKPYQITYELLPGENSLDILLETIYPREELDHLARLVHAEAEGEPYVGKVAVAASVLHRVESPLYPSTLKGVIYQVTDGRYYQYSPVLDGRIKNPASKEAWQAVYDALAGWDPSKGATGFYNPRKTSNRWVRSRPVTVVIGGHVFFK